MFSGVLDETETQLLERGVEIKLKRQGDFPSVVPPPPPEDLLDNIPWLTDDEETQLFIKSHSTTMDYDFGDIIMQEGDQVDGIHIVIYGMMRLYGSLFGQIQLFNLDAAKHQDEESSEKDQKKQEDFLCSGNIIGEIGLLTNSVRTCSVTCETAVQTFFVSAEDMEEAFSRFPALKKAMWSVVANRISVPLFLDNMKYQGTGVETIHLMLAKGHIIELTDEDSVFRFSDRVDEVSVVHGTVMSKATREILNAPVLALPEHETLKLHNCPFAILLVVPRNVGLEIISSDSRSLLLHNSRVVSQARLSGTRGTVPSSDVSMD